MLHPSQGYARWNWEEKHIISFVTANSTLHSVKGITAKLQKNGRDIYEAYQMIDDVRSILTKEMRTNIAKEFQD